MSNPMGRMLVTVTAPHYCASLVIGRRTLSSGVLALEAAPILRWTLGKSWLTLDQYFARKGFTVGMQLAPTPHGRQCRIGFGEACACGVGT